MLPILSMPHSPADHDVVITAGDWLTLFPGAAERVLLPIPIIQSVWYADDIAGETEHVLDDGLLTLIDRALCRYFSLPGPDV